MNTNEIDPRRRELLALQGFEPTAPMPNVSTISPLEKTYHAVVMNPPFSATGGRVNSHRTAFGARHIEQALLRLKPGGRLVAIVGRGMASGILFIPHQSIALQTQYARALPDELRPADAQVFHKSPRPEKRTPKCNGRTAASPSAPPQPISTATWATPMRGGRTIRTPDNAICERPSA